MANLKDKFPFNTRGRNKVKRKNTSARGSAIVYVAELEEVLDGMTDGTVSDINYKDMLVDTIGPSTEGGNISVTTTMAVTGNTTATGSATANSVITDTVTSTGEETAVTFTNGIIAVNSITEKTADAGVGIDGVTIKDGKVSTSGATVAQATNINTAVTANGVNGLITTQSASTAADASDTFTVSCSSVTTSSVVLANVVDYAGTFGTNGLPVVSVDAIGDGQFDIVVMNAGSTALSGVLKIGFLVIR